jgi:hypothetical protein
MLINLKNLLQNVAMIQKKYDDLAEYSGEHYNVFDILGVRTNELSHSAILTNLLDTKGKHGQKDVFLELFLDIIKPRLENSKYKDHINSFVTKKARAKKEISIGGINYETAEGGRVDIVISSGNEHIVIENKIYAVDQDQQLLRYNNHYKNDPILYLTLKGDEPSETSKGSLILGVDFICVSYKDDITNWLEKCIKEMVNKPIIRETLNQYLFLIKSLTNQSNNNKMSEEIRNLIDEENVDSIVVLNNELRNIITEIRREIFSRISYEINLNHESFIKVVLDEDGDGIFIGYQYFFDKINNSTNEKAKDIRSIIEKISKNKIFFNNNYVAWYHPITFNKKDRFESIGNKEILKMHKNPEYLDRFINKIKDEEKLISNELKKLIS